MPATNIAQLCRCTAAQVTFSIVAAVSTNVCATQLMSLAKQSYVAKACVHAALVHISTQAAHLNLLVCLAG